MYRCIFFISRIFNDWVRALTIRDCVLDISEGCIGFGAIAPASVSGLLRFLLEYGSGFWLQGDLLLLFVLIFVDYEV